MRGERCALTLAIITLRFTIYQLLRFVFCILLAANCFQRTEEERRKKRRSDDSKEKFILSEYERIFSEVATLASPDVYPEIEPKNDDIGYNAMPSSKAAILKLRKE
jgi:hypothetical protein